VFTARYGLSIYIYIYTARFNIHKSYVLPTQRVYKTPEVPDFYRPLVQETSLLHIIPTGRGANLPPHLLLCNGRTVNILINKFLPAIHFCFSVVQSVYDSDTNTQRQTRLFTTATQSQLHVLARFKPCV
jgi:hypothetical protein